MTAEGQVVALVAGDEVIFFAAFRESKAEIVGCVGRAFHSGQGMDVLGNLSNTVYQTGSLIGLDAFGDAGAEVAQGSSRCSA